MFGTLNITMILIIIFFFFSGLLSTLSHDSATFQSKFYVLYLIILVHVTFQPLGFVYHSTAVLFTPPFSLSLSLLYAVNCNSSCYNMLMISM